MIQDLDEPPVGAFWGEVQSNIHRALGCVGAVTNGGVRDLREVEALGFQYYAGSVMVSHAYVTMVDYGTPVTIAGLEIRPGACEAIIAKERTIIDLCRSPQFSVDALKRLQP